MLSIDEIKRRKKTFGKMVQRCADYLQTGAYHVTKTYGKFALKKGRIDFRNPRDYYYWLLFGSYRIHNTSGKAACTTALTSPFDNFIQKINCLCPAVITASDECKRVNTEAPVNSTVYVLHLRYFIICDFPGFNIREDFPACPDCFPHVFMEIRFFIDFLQAFSFQDECFP